jgi:hypothetical protein
MRRFLLLLARPGESSDDDTKWQKELVAYLELFRKTYGFPRSSCRCSRMHLWGHEEFYVPAELSSVSEFVVDLLHFAMMELAM